MKKVISNQAPKGTSDWFPKEFKIRKYIFDTWRQVCLRYGFEEYLSPIIESAEVYRAKSGEDVGGAELMSFMDRGGRELAIRPEMTPSVTRMISQIYLASPKPIKYFSIANFIRNEKPQRGRNREFWQLNFDIFGSTSLKADWEIMQMSLDIVLAFNPPKNSFVMYLNNRKLIDGILELAQADKDNKIEVVRLLDKWQKLDQVVIKDKMSDLGLKKKGEKILFDFMESGDLESLVKAIPDLVDNDGVKEIQETIKVLESLGYKGLVEFNPAIIRGFDYYDGLIFEVFDKNRDNNRAMFGGGRYNGLAEIFGSQSFPAVGCAPGDETMKLFLESWGLLEKIISEKKDCYYLPLLAEELSDKLFGLASKLRKKNCNIELGFEVQKVGKALEYANKKGFGKVIICGEDEIKKGLYKVKDMLNGGEEEVKI
ncbi:MAG: histidine--tRNA ligase [Planctomycetes bacterium]|jgi:histidyl-tRNA synthetase|nr:histidine--tRNA ligase [Planctomycetota bacterium]